MRPERKLSSGSSVATKSLDRVVIDDDMGFGSLVASAGLRDGMPGTVTGPKTIRGLPVDKPFYSVLAGPKPYGTPAKAAAQHSGVLSK